MNKPLLTNASVFRAIVIAAHAEMHRLENAGRRPKDDGTPGWVIAFDPEQKSFKQALIAITFTAMWFESAFHLLVVRDHGIKKYDEYDHRPYREKLELIGITGAKILESAERLQKCRKDLVHEKAHLDKGQFRAAQEEADNACELLLAIESQVMQKSHTPPA
jgi:hypothetical protein